MFGIVILNEANRNSGIGSKALHNLLSMHSIQQLHQLYANIGSKMKLVFPFTKFGIFKNQSKKIGIKSTINTKRNVISINQSYLKKSLERKKIISIIAVAGILVATTVGVYVYFKAFYTKYKFSI